MADAFSWVTLDSFALFTVAVLTVFFGALGAKKNYALLAERNELESVTITTKTALLFPVISSVMLMLFFFLFDVVGVIILVLVFVYGVLSVSYALSIILRALPIGTLLTRHEIRVPCLGYTVLNEVVSGLLALIVTLAWLLTGHWMLNNVLAVSACLLVLGFMHLPNIKVATILLVCLFFYDIFWVFYSEGLFGANVMTTVATKEAQNVASTIGSQFGITSIVKTIQLPMKIIWHSHLLGLGDIVLPGLLVSFALKFDGAQKDLSGNETRYFPWCLFGYALGLFSAMVAVNVFRVAQPALLYLVPSTLGALLLTGWRRGELKLLWQGIPSESVISLDFASEEI